MNLRKISSLLFVLTLLVSLAPTLGLAQDVPATGAEKTAADQADTPAAPPGVLRPVVSLPLQHDVSPPLQSMKPIPAEPAKAIQEIPRLPLPKTQAGGSRGGPLGPILQDWPGTVNMPPTIQNFEGVNNVNGVLPPDTNGDVGPNHYVQWVNLSFAIWDKTGTLLYGPANGNTLWQGFGGACETTNDGDPITLYDPIADRWLMSQFAFPAGSYHQCIAISQTPDPTGAWYRYDYQVSTTKMNDYPKFGVWPDAYYMTANQFDGGTFAWQGQGVWAFERDKMLQGQAAQMVYFDLYSVNPNFGGMLPADLDGATLPPTGAPGIFAEWDDSAWLGDPNDTLRLWEFHVDWVTPANSTFGVSGQPNYSFATADVDPDMCGFARNCIPQPGGSNLDAISDRLMYRLQYRNFGGYQALVSNHTVDADGSDHAGVHWFELRDGGGWAMYQEGVYAPDSDHRWMGSVALDQRGNMAVGYSVSSGSTYPSIRYAGRLEGDPLGTLPQAEATLIAGSGYQEHSAGRWGDYSMMAVDPVDDCTFWFTTEYYATVGNAPWQTRIGSFQFPSCLGATGTLSGTVTESGSGTPIIGAKVTAQTNPTFVTYSQSPDGAYTFAAVPTGTYTVTAEAYGYLPQTFSGIDVLSGTVTTQNFDLNVAPSYVISGYVTDATTDWPLYASLDISGPSYPGSTIWTDPETGFYSITLVSDITYTFEVAAWVDGYLPESRDVPVTSDATEDYALDADLLACTAPGYDAATTLLLTEDFDAGIPGAWNVVDNGGDCVWVDTDPGGRGNLTGGSGAFAIADSDDCGSGTTMNTDLESPTFDASGYAGLLVEYKNDYYDLGSTAQVDVYDGSAWTTVDDMSGSSSRGPETRVIGTSAGAGAANAQVRFHYEAGWDWWWEVDEVRVYGRTPCVPTAGGLVVGNVYDDNTGDPLVGADVENEDGYATTTAATPDDPDVDDAFYTLFSPQGTKTFSATMTNYAPDVVAVTVVQSDTVGQDFSLSTGYLSYTPPTLEASLDLGLTTTVPFTLSNTGGTDASFEFLELEGAFEPVRLGKLLSRKGNGLDDVSPRYHEVVGPLAVGDELFQVDAQATTGHALLLGVEWADGYYWVTSGGQSSSSDPNYLFKLDKDGNVISSWDQGTSSDWGWRDLAFDGTYLYASDSNVVQQIDPATGAATGVTIPCPGGLNPCRALAYDPDTDHFWTANWASNIYEFDRSGTIINTFANSLSAYGMAWDAWSPGGPYLWVWSQDGTPEVLATQIDPTTGTATGVSFVGVDPPGESAGGADIIAGDHPDYAGILVFAGMHQATPDTIVGYDLDAMVALDVPWLNEDPISGTVASLTDAPIDITFDAGQVDQPGAYHAQLKVDNDTPYDLDNVPVTMTVLAPASWGKLNGTVTGLGYCDADPGPLEGAQVEIMSANATIVTTTVLTEDFESWLPTGWITVNNIISDSCAWESTATTGRINYAGGDGEAADADSDWCGSGTTMDTELWTPALDLSGYDAASLDFVAAFRYLSGDYFEVDVSSDGGTTWTNALHWVESHAGTGPGEAVSIDLTPYLSANVVVRFHYVALGWDWYAEVDQVRVTGSAYTDGVWTLQTDENGYYQVWMDETYSPLTVTVTYPDHETGLAPSLMVTGQMTTTQDFDLRWLVPCVSAEPDSLHVTVNLGVSTTLPITVSNAGAVSTTVAMTELDRGFVPVTMMTFDQNRPQGAAPVAAAMATSLDQFAARNLAYKDLIVVPNAPTQDILLDQPPNQANGIFSDVDSPQAVAENFFLAEAKGIAQIVFWTGYHPGDTPIDPDHITVIFHQDAGGLPGAAIYTENDVAYDRVQTGVTLFGVHEWMHTLTLASPVFLAPGTYWVEIYNDTGSGTDDFFWETGDLDATNGVAGSAWASTVPGSGWTADGATDLAIQLIEAVGAVPWLDEDPIASDVAADIGSQVVTVTFDAGVPEVDQPGDYLATLHARSDDPVNDSIAIPVTMTVLAPASWGKLNGTVTGLGYCDADPGPLEGAQVHVQSSEVDTMTIVVSTTLLTEDFESWLPTGWVTVTNGGCGDWNTNVFWNRDNYAGGDGMCADADADECGSAMDTELWTPALDLSGYDAASLDFVAAYNYLSGDYFEVDVSSNGGTTWTNVLHWAEDHDANGPGEAVSIALTPFLSANVVVRFHYFADSWDWYAMVDQVRVTGLNDVEVQLPVFWDLETDANGYYQVWMDESYSPVTVTVTIPDHEGGEAANIVVSGQTTTTQDFDLRWLQPCVSVSPLSMEATVVRGNSETLPLDLSNNGALSTTFEMQELEGTRQLADILTFEEQVPQESTAPVVATMATSLDQFAARNLAYKDLIVVPNVLAQNLLLDQPPNQSNGLFSDVGCDGCTAGQQAVAENFSLSAATAIGQIVFWSGYHPGDTPVDPDHITVIFHQDAGGLPGAAIYTENDVAYNRVQTGVVLFGVHEWLHTLTLANPVPLAPGTYWVEIYNDTGAGTDDFFWEAGDLDATHGVAGMAWAAAAPGSGWTFDGTVDLAIQLIEAGGDVPWLSEDPITGTVNADSSFPVSITFTAFPAMTGGIYTATVVAKTDDPVHSSIGVPVTMTVVYAPVCSFETSTPDDLGMATVFTNTTDNGYAATTYRWDFGDGSAVSAATNPTHTYDLPGFYTAVLTAENTYGANVCTATVSVEGVVAGFTSNSSVVLGEPVIFTNTTISNPGVVQWLWTFGDGDLDSTETPTHTYTVAGTYTVTLFASYLPGGPNSPEMPENVYDFYVGTVEVVTSRYQIYLPLVNKSY